MKDCPHCGYHFKGNECGACGARLKTVGMKVPKVNKVSDKKKDEDKIYTVRRKVFLAENPQCAVFSDKKATEVHHMRGRGRYYLDESTWLPVSKDGHHEINTYPVWAADKGFTIKRSV